ncbi:hypothetical protein Franean1_3774 [Parafrankia sp. EAN1pec]|uniref:hypothetical protein n=1 Tax=Parafrankia sp. (strain EAN1pec) TaxID=298653 RepID=UPI00015D9D12|nr:hypothetical protein Franean1_3774 [Frankia sp. EAN1pec]
MIDAAWSPGRQQVPEGDTDAIGCAFSSPKGFVILWSSAQDAEAGYRSSRAAPAQQPQEDLSGVGYEGYTYTSPGNVQEVRLLKGDAYVSVTVGQEPRRAPPAISVILSLIDNGRGVVNAVDYLEDNSRLRGQTPGTSR